jgi:hypothetical protein
LVEGEIIAIEENPRPTIRYHPAIPSCSAGSMYTIVCTTPSTAVVPWSLRFEGNLLLGDAGRCFITLLVREPDVARSSGRVGGIAVAETAVPLRNAVALSVVDIAVLVLRATAVLLLLSPVILLVLLASG